MKKLFFIFLLLLAVSCSYKKFDDVRKVKKNISTAELKLIMGEPYDVEIEPGYEEWTFYYDGGRKLNEFIVVIKSDTVTNFYSY